MKLRFYVAGEKGREEEIAKAVCAGVEACGDTFECGDSGQFVEPSDAEVACVFALKGHSKRILEAYSRVGAHTLLFDKPLIRASTGMGAQKGKHHYRVSLDEFMPLGRMMRQRWPSWRWCELGMHPKPRSQLCDPLKAAVIYAGSSQKYCDFHELGDATEYATQVIWQIRKQLAQAEGKHKRAVIYRPKPSWPGAVPIEGTKFSRPPQPLGALLSVAPLVLVTHGSHAAIDAILAGVPAIVLGQGAALPVSSGSLDVLHTARPLPYPNHSDRLAWLSALAWWQWRLDEMANGEMWRFLRAEMDKPAS